MSRCGGRMRGNMDIGEILQKVDALYEENKGGEAEALLTASASQAAQEGDQGALLQLLNELMGYYRQTSQRELSYRVAEQARALAEEMGLKGTEPYATTLLNVATVYRAGGRLQESLECYREVEQLYQKLYPQDNMLTASLQNNLSLLYQELGEYEKARACQEKALDIVRKNNENDSYTYEEAVTGANLAATCAQLGEGEEARRYALGAVELFERIGARDSHYAAALATLGLVHFKRGEYAPALEFYTQAMELVEQGVGRNEAYERLQEYVQACRESLEKESGAGQTRSPEDVRQAESAAGQAHSPEGVRQTENAAGQAHSPEGVRQAESGAKQARGLEISRAYYEALGRPMIAEKFPEYEERIAVGLVGKGSDCFGFDDEASRDHDWGPSFCMWLTDEDDAKIGEALREAYDSLPAEFEGFRRAPRVNGQNRRGVMRISDFYRELAGTDCYEQIDWRQVPDHQLAEAVNGQVFRDDLGVFSAFREKLQAGYPEEILRLKLAESASAFSQGLQYNYPRMWKRGEDLSARMLAWDGWKAAMKLVHYILGKYPPHDKWLHRSLREAQADGMAQAVSLLDEAARAFEKAGETQGQAPGEDAVERLGASLAMELYARDIISDIDSYLDHHAQELVYKASLAPKSREELAKEIARLEFEAFDKVKNEGGRASCQDDWPTFSIMRMSQYLTWDRTMLGQYLYDFHREYALGHNLIEEKYGRMMESTAPEAYQRIKGHFPELTEEKKAIIEQICGIQVGWMEEFAKDYPALAQNARSIHTYQDNPFDTSYETYLRGELGTYSDKMLELYGRYIVGYVKEGGNLARDIMENSVHLYGYADIREAEEKTRAAAAALAGKDA